MSESRRQPPGRQSPQREPVSDGCAPRETGVRIEPVHSGSGEYRICLTPPDDMMSWDFDPVGILKKLRQFGDCSVTGDLSALPDLEHLNTDVCRVFWTIEIRTALSAEELRSLMVPEPNKGRSGSPVPRVGSTTPRTIVAGTGPDPQSESGNSPGGEETGPDSAPDGPLTSVTLTTIHIPPGKMDVLTDLAAGFVNIHGHLQLQSEKLDSPELTAISETVRGLTDELQEFTTGLRSIPVSRVFDDLHRLVRVLRHRWNREIHLETAGGDIGLDQSVMEPLSHSLLHIICRAVSRETGFGDPGPAAGNGSSTGFFIEAGQDHGSVTIDISDGGNRVLYDRILTVSEGGSLSAAEAAAAREMVLDLITAPDSSAGDNSRYRFLTGTGPAGIHQSIRSMGGSIGSIEREEQEAAIRIRLAPRLAVVDGLIVGLGEGRYVLPMTSVMELIDYPGTGGVGPTKGMIQRRGVPLPLIYLADFFQSPENISGDRTIAVTAFEGSLYGLVVDEVVGRQQSVVRHLSVLNETLSGISGFAILSDGTIAHKVDIAQVIRGSRPGISGIGHGSMKGAAV